MPEESPHLGVLFVHGIGSQRAGSTLRGFGGPLIASAGRWLGEGSVVRPSSAAQPGGPVHERVTIVDGARTMEVLAAESCWAEEVPPPSYGALLAWLFTAVPFIVTRAFDTGLRRTNRAIDGQLADESRLRPASPVAALVIAWWVAVRVVQNLLVVVVSLVVLAILILFGLVGLLGGDRDGLRGLRAIVVGYIGDSYALLQDADAPRAITARVRRDLEWLEQRLAGAPVVVVAHSQGAEVVRRVLAPRRDRVAALVTFGSGIEKLDAVDRLRHSLGRSLTAFAARIVSAVALVLAVVAALDGAWWPWVAGLVAVALASLTTARALMRSIVGTGYDFSRLGVGPGQVARWTDLYATSDPVSENSLPVESLGSSTEIVNRRLIFTDHTSYWQNVEAFHAAVALEIARAAGWWDAVELPSQVVLAAKRRAGRVWWLVAARWVAILGAIAGWLALGGGLLAAAVVAVAAVAAILAAEVAWRGWSNRRTNAEFTAPRASPRRSAHSSQPKHADRQLGPSRM